MAPLDFARVEVHVGPSPEFEPTQGTLRDTIETPQGGSCTVPLPYTDWWVKLRGRSLAGVAGSASDAVAGTPRRAGTKDLQAGSVTADSIAADAISGKHITGGTIDGAVVTGSTVRTGASGSRVVVTPNPPAPMEQIPSLLLHSASDLEQAPGSLRANIRTDGKAYPALELTAPAVQLDRWERPDIAQLTLLSPQLDVQGGAFVLASTTGLNKDHGEVSAAGISAKGPKDTGLFRIYVQDGREASGNDRGSVGARSWLDVEGAKVTVRTTSSGGDATTTVTPENITVGTWVSHRGTDWCPIQLSANVTEGQVPPQVRVTPHRTIELSGYVDLKDPEVRPGRQIGLLPEGYRPAAFRRVLIPSTAGGVVLRLDIYTSGALQLYPMVGSKASWVGFDGVSCRAN
ncbi:hypothetical protein AB0I10_12405 [Streptomyces sp. NPDC050636]|uniref:hypothetical protein n=1 Tax=Streptomyces sp. NPDC050636 TaxID=3154510 RepID=UPI00341C5FCF